MVKVRNDAGETFEIEEKDLAAAKADGYLPIEETTTKQPTETFTVINPKKNEILEILQSDLEAAKKDGYRPLSAEERDTYLKQQEKEIYGDMDITAGLAGGLRGATFGLSDAIVANISDAHKSSLKKLQDENPWASIAGETVGSVIPSIATGAGVAAAAPKMASTLGKTGAQVAARAAEGAAFGTGVAISEEALDPEHQAENSVAEIVLGGLIGGGVTAAAKPLKAAGRYVFSMAREQPTPGLNTMDDIADAAKEHLATNLQPHLNKLSINKDVGIKGNIKLKPIGKPTLKVTVTPTADGLGRRIETKVVQKTESWVDGVKTDLQIHPEATGSISVYPDRVHLEGIQLDPALRSNKFGSKAFDINKKLLQKLGYGGKPIITDAANPITARHMMKEYAARPGDFDKAKRVLVSDMIKERLSANNITEEEFINDILEQQIPLPEGMGGPPTDLPAGSATAFYQSTATPFVGTIPQPKQTATLLKHITDSISWVASKTSNTPQATLKEFLDPNAGYLRDVVKGKNWKDISGEMSTYLNNHTKLLKNTQALLEDTSVTSAFSAPTGHNGALYGTVDDFINDLNALPFRPLGTDKLLEKAQSVLINHSDKPSEIFASLRTVQRHLENTLAKRPDADLLQMRNRLSRILTDDVDFGEISLVAKSIDNTWDILNNQNKLLTNPLFYNNKTSQKIVDNVFKEYAENPTPIASYIGELSQASEDIYSAASIVARKAKEAPAEFINMKTFGGPHRVFRNLQELAASNRALAKQVPDIIKASPIYQKNQSSRNEIAATLLSRLGLPGLGGYAAGGVLGAGVAAGVSHVMHSPKSLIGTVGRAGGALSLGTKAVGNAVNKVFAKELLTHAAVATEPQIVKSVYDMLDDNKIEDIEKKLSVASDVDQLEGLVDYIGNISPDLDTSLATQDKALRAADFLIDKLPKNPFIGTDNAGKWQPTPHEINKTKLYIKYTHNPLSAIDDIINKGYISKEAQEVLTTLYPRTLMEIQTQLIENQDKFEKLQPKQKKALKELLNIKAPSASLDAYQSVHKPAEPGKPTGKKVPQTQTDRLSAGRLK